MGYTLKGRDVIKLEAIAKKLGKSYSECFAEIVGRAHDAMLGSAEGQSGAQTPNAKKTETVPSGDSSADATADEALEQDGEPDDGDGVDTRETEHQDAPVMKGEKPNPLAIKRWANTPDEEEDDEEDKEKPPAAKASLGGERWREIQRQRRVGAQGRSQK